jgi:catechol 2,3-dioxygenase-like lactoylglutathione lyase family enzyme
MFTIKETNVTIMVKDMDASVKFYEQIGLKVKNRWENHYAQMAGPDIIIGLHPASRNLAGSDHVSIGFIVDAMEEVKNELTKLGISFQNSEDKAGIFAYTKDPDGTIIYFMQPKMSW